MNRLGLGCALTLKPRSHALHAVDVAKMPFRVAMNDTVRFLKWFHRSSTSEMLGIKESRRTSRIDKLSPLTDSPIPL